MSKTLLADPTSDAVVLVYIGDGRYARNTPARDLTEADIARLTFQRSLAEVAADVGQPIDREDPDSPLIERPDPRKPDLALAAAIVEELLATKLFKEGKPVKEPKGAKAADTDTTPPPADTPPATPAEPEV